MNGELATTVCCDTTCQRAHWSTHKPECKASNVHKCLYRAGDLTAAIFLRISRESWDTCILHIERAADERLRVIQSEVTNDTILVPFPDPFFREAEVSGVLAQRKYNRHNFHVRSGQLCSCAVV